MSDTRTIHLADANADVTLSLSYGDLIAIEDAGNAAIKINPETSERVIDGTFITARRNALLTYIPKSARNEDGTTITCTLDWVKKLSASDGKVLEEEAATLLAEANAVNEDGHPKGSPSKEQ